MAEKKATKKQKQSKEAEADSKKLRKEIIILISLAVCILLTISNFGLGGVAGKWLSYAMTGLFGWMAYPFPLLLFAGIAFILMNRGKKQAYFKTLCCTVLMLLLCAALEMIQKKGGFFGRAMTTGMVVAVGIAGTYVVILIFSIICLIFITNKSFLSGVKKGGSIAYERARDNGQKRKELREKKEEEKALSRKDKVVSGVTYHTTLEKTPPDVVELTPPEERKPHVGSFPVDVHPLKPFLAEEGRLPLKETPPEIVHMPIPREEPEEIPEIEPTPIREPEPKPKKKLYEDVEEIEIEIPKLPHGRKDSYKKPPLNLLEKGQTKSGDSTAFQREMARKLEETFRVFDVAVKVTDFNQGPSVTRFEVKPDVGVRVNRIVKLEDDIKLNLKAANIRIEAPIPGKAAVGIEIPNEKKIMVRLRDLLETPEFKNMTSDISFAVGRDLTGNPVIADINKMPHLLIAGATGSGKSVGINTLIISLLYKAHKDDVKLIMIDPKVVELSIYCDIPHLLIPVVTDPKKAAAALNWAVAEMERRYLKFSDMHVRDISGFNSKVMSLAALDDEEQEEKMSRIVIIVDELADLMMVAAGDVETAICRLAQKARAAGIHLILATQRPSVDVITGTIKANMPSRIAFTTSSAIDSRTIINMQGAEKLLGNGDMLFFPSAYPQPLRVQGAFVTDAEVEKVVDYLVKQNGEAAYDEEVTEQINMTPSGTGGEAASSEDERDAYFYEAGMFIIEKEKASIGMLQRVFKIGFNRAARMMDQLAEAGVVSKEDSTKARQILMTKEAFEEYMNQ